MPKIDRLKLKSFLSNSWAVSWPMTVIMLFEFLMSIVEVYCAGRIGKEAQATYGIVIQLYFAFIVVANALSIGAVAIISKAFTSGDKEGYEKAVITSVLAAVAFGIFFAAVGFIFSAQIISLMSIPEELKARGAVLLKYFALGFGFDYILIITNGILRSSKRIKLSLLTMTFVTIADISLCFILVLNTNVGFNGIAFAAVSALGIGAMINLFYVLAPISLRTRPALDVIKKQLKIGWPSGVLQVLWQLGALALFMILGKLPQNNIEFLAAFTNGMRIESALFLPAFAFNMAAAVVVGNLLGEKKENEAVSNGLVSAGLGVAIVSVLTVFIVINAKLIVPILSNNDIVIRESANYIYICMSVEPILAWGIILMGCLNGAGDTYGVMKIVALSIWLVRIPLCYITGIVLGWGAHAVWISMNVSIIVQTIFITRRYLKKNWLRLEIS